MKTELDIDDFGRKYFADVRSSIATETMRDLLLANGGSNRTFVNLFVPTQKPSYFRVLYYYIRSPNLRRLPFWRYLKTSRSLGSIDGDLADRNTKFSEFLLRINDDIANEADRIVSRDLHPIVATSVTARANGTAFRIPFNQRAGILIDDGVFSFCSNVSRYAANLFDHSIEGNASHLTFKPIVSSEASRHSEDYSWFRNCLLPTILKGHHFDAKIQKVDRELTRVYSAFLMGMEYFLVGHEYGHVAAGHFGASNAIETHRAIGDHEVVELATRHEEEFEADRIGIDLALRALDKPQLEPLHTVGVFLFLFFAEKLVLANRVLTYGTDKPTGLGSHPSAIDRISKIIEHRKNHGIIEATKQAQAIVEDLDKFLARNWDIFELEIGELHESGQRPVLGGWYRTFGEGN